MPETDTDQRVDDDTRDDQDVDDDATDQDDDKGDDDGDKPLGKPGEKALQAEKEKRRAAQRELREFKSLGLSPAQIKALQSKGSDKGDDDQPNADEIREQARTEARAEALKERVVDKIEAKAAKAFADAEDAVAILLRTHDAEDFLDDGKIDVEAIQEALDELLEKKPHLSAVQDGKRFKGKDPDGGTRKAARPGQLTRDDLKRMSPQEITKAKADGRLADLLGTK